VKEAKEVHEVKEWSGTPKPMWIAIWAVAIVVTAIGGNPYTVDWKAVIQLPGSFVVVFLEWFVGPLGTMMTPLVVRILTILTNVAAYYVLVKIILFFWRKLKSIR